MLEGISIYILTIFLLYVMFSQHSTTGLKCELKGMVNDRLQCILHDRGINVAHKEAINVNGTLIWKTRAANRVDLQPWRYSTGLDRNRTFFNGEDEDEFQDHVRKYIPNSRWCGDENEDVPLSYDDLRFYMKIDKCCKQHEGCNSTLRPKSTKGGISNIGLMMRFHCDCEKEFRDCLKRINSGIANKIGFTYFTVYGPQCFKNEYPIFDCYRRRGTRCLEYKYNITKEKRYQWFDVPVY